MDREAVKREIQLWDEQTLRICVLAVLDYKSIEDAIEIARTYLPEEVRKRVGYAQMQGQGDEV